MMDAILRRWFLHDEQVLEQAASMYKEEPAYEEANSMAIIKGGDSAEEDEAHTPSKSSGIEVDWVKKPKQPTQPLPKNALPLKHSPSLEQLRAGLPNIAPFQFEWSRPFDFHNSKGPFHQGGTVSTRNAITKVEPEVDQSCAYNNNP